ncbi:hypothetical protein RD055328_02500 [Companilactobacillus sp. RD055328]|nr:hypothetical protein RD055328_02500 [Companilactobacillus sp. RD055328]
MKKINNDTLNEKTQKLISEIEELTDKKIVIETDTEQTTSYIDLSHSEHVVEDDQIVITITNSPNVEYMIIHELFHIKLDFSDFTKMSVNLYGNDANFNQQSQITASSLKGIVDHRMIAYWEQEGGFRTESIQKSLNAGTIEMLAAEGTEAEDSELVLYRTLVMLDNFNEETIGGYEQPSTIAQKLNDVIQDVTNKNQHYSALVRLFFEFDNNIKILGYIDLLHTQLITLTPIFSERQLRLTVNQVIEIVHTDLITRDNIHPFVLEMKSSHQNSGFIEISNKNQNPDFFKELYQTNLADFLAEYNIDYLIR